MAKNEFVTAINCMDGRVQEPVMNWMKQRYDALYVDMITEAGPNKLLRSDNKVLIENIYDRVRVSTDRHGSEYIAIAGHYDCAGYPVSAEKKKGKIMDSVELIESWNLGFKEIAGLYINDKWEVEVVCIKSDNPIEA
ncbi:MULTISPECIES: carbonic anhydrase [Bhargavaea]|uniref:Carbonic anhydrase n=1 Tax=Bhargavaea changchunensis TaxID=2134037 RepID=A0ABW2NLI9_9BACL|nr:carbonic anhydrase [Bhargavaea sp. CC-171006]